MTPINLVSRAPGFNLLQSLSGPADFSDVFANIYEETSLLSEYSEKNPTCQFLDFSDFPRTELRERGTRPSAQVTKILSAKPRTRGAEPKTTENTYNKTITQK